MTDLCAFCSIPPEDVIVRTERCFAIWTNEPPRGSAMVIPVAHRSAPWEMTPEEWSEVHVLLREVVDLVAREVAPDGWNVGWNVGAVGGQSVPHAHCHVVPRHDDEPYAGRGLRWWFKQDSNRRPAQDPHTSSALPGPARP